MSSEATECQMAVHEKPVFFFDIDNCVSPTDFLRLAH